MIIFQGLYIIGLFWVVPFGDFATIVHGVSLSISQVGVCFLYIFYFKNAPYLLMSDEFSVIFQYSISYTSFDIRLTS